MFVCLTKKPKFLLLCYLLDPSFIDLIFKKIFSNRNHPLLLNRPIRSIIPLNLPLDFSHLLLVLLLSFIHNLMQVGQQKLDAIP